MVGLCAKEVSCRSKLIRSGGWSGGMFVAACLGACPGLRPEVRAAIQALKLSPDADCIADSHGAATLESRDGTQMSIRSTSYKASHHDQDIVFANRAGALVNYSGIRAGEPASENTLTERSTEGGL
jgi:hypothetical protein